MSVAGLLRMSINRLPVTIMPLGKMLSGIFMEESEKVTFFGYTIVTPWTPAPEDILN